MNNFKKIGLTALAGALVSVSANAADLSVTGGASMTFGGQEETLNGNGWSMNDGITFGASAELDNGWTVSTSMVLDSSDGGGTAAQVLDTRILTIDMGDSGVFKFAGDGGSGVLSAVDDTTPTAKEESWDVVDGATTPPGGPSGNNMMHYSNSSLMDGLTVAVAHVPSDKATEIESSTDYGVTYTGFEGLTIGLGAGEDNGEGAGGVEYTNMYAKYAFEAFTVGIQANESDSATASADISFSAMGVSYAVNEDLSVSLNTSTVDYENTSLTDQEGTGISMSYTMGSMTLSAAHVSVDNIAGTSANDRSGYEIGLSFAF
jgi:outer membrane protein OmpU